MKAVNVSANDYRLTVQSGGTITLNTGAQTGQVVITGDLYVAGNTTTVESETMTVKDNIIIVNSGESGNGINAIVGYKAGLQVDRGNYPDVAFVFDETVNHRNASGISTSGTYKFYNTGTNALIGIQTPSINTDGQKLYLINTGTGYVTVTGTSQYEQQILDYADWISAGSPRPPTTLGNILLTSDEDGLVNTQALVDYVDSKLYYYTTTVVGLYDTTVTAYDTDNGDPESKIVVRVDNQIRAEFTNSGLTVDDVNIFENIITTENTNADLVLRSATNLVEIDGYLILRDRPDISTEAGTATVYTKNTVGGGDTGLYFVNTKTDTDGSSLKVLQDELVSRRRALVLSFIF